MTYISSQFPTRRIYAVGVSLGAAILTKYMVYTKDKCPIAAAFCLGCHFDTIKAMDFLKTNLFGLYDYMLGFTTKILCRPLITQYD